MVSKTFMIKKTYGSGIKKDKISNKVHKPIVRKFKKRKVYSPFIDNICHADLYDMELISKCTKGIRFLLFVMDNFRKYVRIIPLKDKKEINLLKKKSICK